MNSEFPSTRRDVVALVTYATLGYNVLNPLLYFLCQLVFRRIPYFQASPALGNLPYYAVDSGIKFVFALAFLPFVSLIASGVAGRNSSHTTIRRQFSSLVIPCIGIVLFVLSFPSLAHMIYDYLRLSVTFASATSSGTTIRSFFLQSIVVSLVCVSVGFMLAFFPAIFGTLRARSRDEESAVWAAPVMDVKPDEL